MSPVKEVEVLLVEDDPGDVELIREGLKDSKTTINLNIVDDGIKAMISEEGTSLCRHR
jgi:two-component system response regulator